MNKSVFQRVYGMNAAFGNNVGDYKAMLENNPDVVSDVLAQSKNIFHEFCELLVAFGYDEKQITHMRDTFEQDLKLVPCTGVVDVVKMRDSLCDINVFSIGTHYKAGYDAEEDTNAVIDQVMTRFVKDEDDLQATMQLHASKGVSVVYTEGQFPKMIVKSAIDQPDAPKGKFLKSASCQKKPTFVAIPVFAIEADAKAARDLIKAN